MKMCQAFARNGHEVLLLANNSKKLRENIDDIYSFYGVEDIFRVKTLPWISKPGKYFFYAFKASCVVKKAKPDLIYCRDLISCFFVSYLKFDIILESHAAVYDNGSLIVWMFKKIIRKKRLKKIVVITHALKKYYQNNFKNIGIPLQVAPDGADPLPVNIRPAVLVSDPSKMQIGYVGSFYKGKGLEIVLKLADACTWAEFNIVGGNKKEIEECKQDNPNLHNIHFYGYQPHSKVCSYIKAFDVLLLPNQQKVAVLGGSGNIGHWTSPLKLFEYMAARKPILCSDIDVLKEIVEHERNALLCDPESIEEWKINLEIIKNDEVIANKIADQAFFDFKNNYSWFMRAKKVLT